jgi:hypothetical protein
MRDLRSETDRSRPLISGNRDTNQLILERLPFRTIAFVMLADMLIIACYNPTPLGHIGPISVLEIRL